MAPNRLLRSLALAAALAAPMGHGAHGQAPAPVPVPTPTPQPAPAPLPPAPPIFARAIITLPDGRPVPATWPLGAPLRLSGKLSDVGKHPESFKWEISPPWVDQRSLVADDRATIDVATGIKPKSIAVRRGVGLDDSIDWTVVNITFVVDPDEPGPMPDSTPQPTPGPTPGPAPPAPPVPGPTPTPVVLSPGWHATLVINGKAPYAELMAIAPVADSPTIDEAVKAIGGLFHRLDTNSPDYARSKLDSVLPLEDATGKKVTTPALVVQDATGKVVRKVASPTTEAEFLAYLKTLTGVR